MSSNPTRVPDAASRREYGNEPIHEWFGLTYANYLVVPRSVLQSMPAEWQAKFVAALDELHDAYGHLDWPDYHVEALARPAEFGVYVSCPDCDGEEGNAACVVCAGEGEVYEARYETAEEVGFRSDPIPHYNRGRTHIEPKAAA